MDGRRAALERVVELVLRDEVYSAGKVAEWMTRVSDGGVEAMREMSPCHKCIVNTVIAEKAGEGVHTTTSAFWDSEQDASVTVRWENKTLYCIVTAYTIAL